MQPCYRLILNLKDRVFNEALIPIFATMPGIWSFVPHEYYEDAKRLIRLLEIFLPVPSDEVPNDSILREFIGDSCFYD